jgi:hypothetical protein
MSGDDTLAPMETAHWVAFWAGLLVLMMGMLVAPFLRGRRHQRRFYWLCWAVGTPVLAGVFALRDGDVGFAILLALGLAVAAVWIAFFKSSYLKLGGRIFAAKAEDRIPDEEADRQARSGD